MNIQHVFYSFAWELETGERPKGVIRNLIRIPQLKSGNIVARLKEDVPARPEFYFQRVPVEWDKETYGAQVRNLSHMLHDFCENIGKLDYMNTTACMLPFVCPFLDLCANGNKMLYADDGVLFKELQ